MYACVNIIISLLDFYNSKSVLLYLAPVQRDFFSISTASVLYQLHIADRNTNANCYITIYDARRNFLFSQCTTELFTTDCICIIV